MKIDILLPVYNGEKYLKEQIDSLLGQTNRDFRLLIRDDSSSDGSVDIINEIIKNIPPQSPEIIILRDEKGNLGSTKSFEELVKYVEGDYFMFCDQDDIWKPDKIDVTLEKMKEEESLNPNLPILICTDSACIDQYGNVIADSFYRSQKFEYTFDSREKMAALNIIQGNTCMMNKKCKEYIHGIPQEVVYDAWVGLVIAYYGKVFYLYEQTLFYRQHAYNAVGSNHISLRYFVDKFLGNKNWAKNNDALLNSLPYHLHYGKWLYWKIFYTIKRIIKH